MKKLTNKEKEIMDLYWKHGPMFVRELQEHYAEPRPHFNTLSTIVRILEREGFLDHKQFGNTYQYSDLRRQGGCAHRDILYVLSPGAGP